MSSPGEWPSEFSATVGHRATSGKNSLQCGAANLTSRGRLLGTGTAKCFSKKRTIKTDNRYGEKRDEGEDRGQVFPKLPLANSTTSCGKGDGRWTKSGGGINAGDRRTEFENSADASFARRHREKSNTGKVTSCPTLWSFNGVLQPPQQRKAGKSGGPGGRERRKRK